MSLFYWNCKLIEQVHQIYSTALLISFCFFFSLQCFIGINLCFFFQVLPEVISKHMPKEAVPLILRRKVAVDAHNYSASSSSSSQPDVGAGAVAQHHELLDWPVTWRPTACTSSICDGWSQFVKDCKLEVGDFCRFRQNALDKSVFEVEITRPIKLWSRWRRRRRRRMLLLLLCCCTIWILLIQLYMWSIYWKWKLVRNYIMGRIFLNLWQYYCWGIVN